MLSRLTGDTTLIQTVVGSSISMGLRSLFQFIGGMIMLAVTSLYLFSLNLGLMALLTLPILAIGRKVKKLSRESQDRIADASALAGEILNAMPTVQAYTQEQQEAGRFAERTEASFVTAIRRTRVRAALTALIITAVMGTIIFVLWIGARQVHDGTLTGGQLASFVLYAALVAGAVGTMAEVWGDVMRAAGATERLLDLLHAESAIRETSRPQTPVHPAQAAIRFDHVTFCYPARPQTRALDDICLDIAPGESVALVGPSGAGKTSLFQLLLRYYEVSDGCIRLNGQDIRQLSLHDLRNGIAIVPQDPVIFSANALENIRYGRSHGERRRRHARGQGRPGGRVRRPFARGLPDLPRRTWHPPVRRPAPAHRDCPRHPERCTVAAARRSHQRPRCGIGNPGAERPQRGHAGTHDADHRSSAWQRCKKSTAS